MNAPTAEELTEAISLAIKAQDFLAVRALMRRLAVIDPVAARSVLDAIDLAVEMQAPQ
jgi:hypothetical protein